MRTYSIDRWIAISIMAGLGAGTSACGKAQGAQDVTVSSLALGTSAAVLDSAAGQAAVTGGTGVTDFKLCLDRIKLIGVDGAPVKKTGETADDGTQDADDIRFAPGLIDVSAGQAVDWGKANIPVGFKLAGVRIKVHKDKKLCGVDYSISFNGSTTSEDVEFKFKLATPVDLDTSTAQLNLSLSEAVTALQQAATAGNLASIKDTIEKAEGSCRK